MGLFLDAAQVWENLHDVQYVYFIFLDQQTGRYFCKSAFRKENTDYTENQSRITLLQKIKITQGYKDILFKKDGYLPKGEE